MLEAISTIIVLLTGVYLIVGLIFAIPFLLRGAGRLDPAARRGSRGFRAIILPGTVALWPVLARKWRLAVRSDR